MAGGTALWTDQQAIYSRLTGDATLMALITGVFDKAPEGQAFPYIDIGDGDEAPFRTFGALFGHETFKTVRIWTQDDINSVGFKQALAIYEQVNALLDCYALSVSGQTTVSCQLEDVSQFVDTDGVTRQVAPTYRIVTQ